jgi:hypothetical protein
MAVPMRGDDAKRKSPRQEEMMSPVRAALVAGSCSSCGAELVAADRFCDQCGSPADAGATTRPDTAPARRVVHIAAPGPDLARARELARHLAPVAVHRASRVRTAMCVQCGADLPAAAPNCPSCGDVTTLPPVVPNQPGPALGSLHRRRTVLGKKWALVVACGPAETTLLLHNGRRSTVATAELSPAVTPDLGEPRAPVSRGPLGRILRLAAAVDRGALSLPWTGDQLRQHAFAALDSMPWAARVTALDVFEVGRPDLVVHCGLGAAETAWLALVAAARDRDYPRVVSAVAVLPPDRYRRKIAIVAAFLDQLRAVPGAATALAPGLHAFADSEPLAVVAQRALGLAPGSVADRMADLVVRASAFTLPTEITQLTGVVSAVNAEPDARAMLGARGRLAVLHNAGHRVAELAGSVELDTAPLAVVDDLIDAGVVTDLATATAGRPPADRVYLTARLAPDFLDTEELRGLGHRDELVRRQLLSGADVTDTECVLGRHAAMVDLLSRKRPDDVVTDSVLPAHREAARALAGMITGAENGERPAALLTDALLADRTTWLPVVQLFGTDALRDAGEEFVRRFSEFFEWLSLVAAREHLFLADWHRAIDAARGCLELATAETVRDEAQNLLACGLHNLGDHAAALRELEAAIEGSYSVALLANIGVVAAHLDTELAAGHLARIAREAPTITMRVNAAHQALVMWRGDRTKIWRGAEGEQQTLPTVLREPLRSIVTERIGLDDFRLIVAAMARFDAEWLAAPSSLKISPHRQSLAARYYVALAAQDMFLSVVEVLATVQDWSTAPEWLVSERDNLVDQTMEFLLEHLNDPDNTAGVIAHALVTKVRGLAPRTEILLALLAVASLAYHITNSDEELADAIVELFRQHRHRIQRLAEEERELPDELAELCVRRITINLQQARQREVGDLVDVYNNALDVLSRVQRGVPIWFEARRVVAAAVETCQRAKRDLRPWLRELEDADVRDNLMDFIEDCADFEAKAQRVLGS